MTELLIAVGIVFVIEGLLYALFPASMKHMIKAALTQSDSVLRLVGLIAIFIGLMIIFLLK